MLERHAWFGFDISQFFLGGSQRVLLRCQILARLFDGIETSGMDLELIESSQLASGVLQMSYRPRWRELRAFANTQHRAV